MPAKLKGNRISQDKCFGPGLAQPVSLPHLPSSPPVLVTELRTPPHRCFSCSCSSSNPFGLLLRRRHDVRRRRPVRALPADPLGPPLRRLHVGRPQRQDSGQTRDEVFKLKTEALA